MYALVDSKDDIKFGMAQIHRSLHGDGDGEGQRGGERGQSAESTECQRQEVQSFRVKSDDDDEKASSISQSDTINANDSDNTLDQRKDGSLSNLLSAE